MKKTIALLTTSMLMLAFVAISNGEERAKEITLTEAIAPTTETIPG